jgi:DNA polymerase-3 subunit gamma/tau
MEQFVVSARKYRPATFDTVVGQEAVTSTLKNAIKTGHLAHAFLFTGPRGVGKTTCARILARTINCENRSEDVVACGECLPCKTFEEGHSMNIFELDAASNNSVDDIRNLNLQVQIAPQVGAKKVYIIDEVHMLSQAAFNAFLKTLEEPPSYAIFILATTEKHKILPTILSRCQVFDFRRIGIGDISRHLGSIAAKEGIEAEPQALHTIAQKADGGLRDALSIFDQLVSFSGNRLTYQDVVKNLNVLDHEHYFRVTDSLIRGDVPAALVEYNHILQQGFDGHLFVTGLARHLRDLLVSQDARTLPLLEVSEDLTARYAQQAQAADRELLIKGLDKLAQCDTQYRSSKEPRLLVELTLIQMCRLGAQAPTPLSNGTPSLEKKSPDVTSAPPPASKSTVVERSVTEPSQADPARPIEVTIPVASIISDRPSPTLVPAPAPAAADKPAYVPKRRLMVDQVSISQPMAISGKAEDIQLADVDLEGPAASAREVNHALLIRIWEEFAQQKKKEGKSSLYATLTDREPKVVGPGKVSFSIVNDVQENYLKNEKPELLGHLRRCIGDPGLELEVIKEEVKVRPRYTNRDRFELLAEKNPALRVLKDAVDLDLG